MSKVNYDVVIIGAGPSGTVAASLLKKQGFNVVIVERQYFPRFSIGESLLPQSMQYLAQAGLVDAVLNSAEDSGFQHKNGAAFHRRGFDCAFDFREKFSQGPGTTFQVKRAAFDKILADECEAKGIEIRYGHQVENIVRTTPDVLLDVKDEAGDSYQLHGRFILDASGFGRVLPRLLNLDVPSDFPVRHSYFNHFEDNIDCAQFDRDKILITVHPIHSDVWFWLIPFSDGSASVGVVGSVDKFDESLSCDQILLSFIDQDPNLKRLLVNAKMKQATGMIKGYSANVSQLYGENYALLGNAGEFLDPVFSSGLTIAMKSASLAAPLVARQLKGESVNWQEHYADELKLGVNTFRHFVEAWYQGDFQDIVYCDTHDTKVREMISSILAGYAWDTKNPFVAKGKRRIEVLAQVCRA